MSTVLETILLCLKNINPDRVSHNGTWEFSLNCIRYLWAERDMGMLAKSVIPNEVRDIWGALQIGVSYSRKSVSTWNLKWINNVIRNCVSQQWKQFTWINKYDTSNAPPLPQLWLGLYRDWLRSIPNLRLATTVYIRHITFEVKYGIQKMNL